MSGSGDMTFNSAPLNLSKTNHYLDFYSTGYVATESSHGNVLLSALSATTAVPEPRYGFLLVSGLLAAVVLGFRRPAGGRV